MGHLLYLGGIYKFGVKNPRFLNRIIFAIRIKLCPGSPEFVSWCGIFVYAVSASRYSGHSVSSIPASAARDKSFSLRAFGLTFFLMTVM